MSKQNNFKPLVVGFKALRLPNGDVVSTKPILVAYTPKYEAKLKSLTAELEELQAKALFDFIEAKKKLKDDWNGEF